MATNPLRTQTPPESLYVIGPHGILLRDLAIALGVGVLMVPLSLVVDFEAWQYAAIPAAAAGLDDLVGLIRGRIRARRGGAPRDGH